LVVMLLIGGFFKQEPNLFPNGFSWSFPIMFAASF
jgi:hypothetical protein